MLQENWRYAVSMKHALGCLIALPLAACMTANSGPALPTKGIIAEIERGRGFLDNLVAAGAAHDAQTMNAEARVGVRNVRCSVTGPDSATCRYETDQCAIAESDADGDGWCARTSKFVRVDRPRGIGDVVDRGWGFDLE